MLYTIAMLAYLIVIALQMYFAVLGMALWKKTAPRLLLLTPELAAQTAPMASYQGLCHVFIVVALSIGFFVSNPVGYAFAFYGLACVIVAGIWGGMTISKRIFFMQAVPGMVAIALRLSLIN